MVTRHDFLLPFDAIHEYREPDLLILGSRVLLSEVDSTVDLVPFTDTPDQMPQEDERRLRVKDLLGVAHRCGDAMDRLKSHKSIVQQWGEMTQQFILEALGKGEAALFQSDAGLGDFSSAKSIYLQIRMRRLASLIPRCDTIPIITGFDLNDAKWKEWRDKYVKLGLVMDL